MPLIAGAMNVSLLNDNYFYRTRQNILPPPYPSTLVTRFVIKLF